MTVIMNPLRRSAPDTPSESIFAASIPLISGFLSGLALILIITLLSGCGPEVDDPYLAVAPACDYLPEPSENELRPACTAALEAVLPIDRASFNSAPAGIYAKTLEAFQDIVSRPLADLRANNTLFGVRTELAGAFPLGLLDVFGGQGQEALPDLGPKNLNRFFFNYLAKKIDRVRYLRTNPNSATAAAGYYHDPAAASRDLFVYEPFWKPTHLWAGFHYATIRAASLLHEGRHGDGFYHVPCTSPLLTSETNSLRNSWNCDADLAGPHGMSALYSIAALRGGSAILAGTQPPRASLSPEGQLFLASSTCFRVKSAINSLPRPLLDKLQNLNCAQAPLQTFLNLENLPMAPRWETPASPPTPKPSSPPAPPAFDFSIGDWNLEPYLGSFVAGH